MVEQFLCMFLSMALIGPSPLPSCTPTSTIDKRRPSSWVLQTIPRSVSNDRDNSSGNLRYLDFLSELDVFHDVGEDSFNILDVASFRPHSSVGGPALPFPPKPIDSFKGIQQTAQDSSFQQQKHPFHTWVKSLKRRATRKSIMEGHGLDKHPWAARWPDANYQDLSSTSRYGKSSSGSSFGFVSAVRSASVSLASASVVARSRRNNSHCPSRTDRSSRDSMPGPRISEDSMASDGALALDLASVKRSLQRRRILEELINTEENYVGDIRFLTNVYHPLRFQLGFH